MPKVSVIIPTYNYGKYIEKAIDSVLAQTYKDFEIIVVDDGSTDNTREIIESKYKNKVQYFYQENKGAPVARNKGIKESRGEYLVFLDADDWFMPENLSIKIKIIENNPENDWVYSDWYFADEKGNIKERALEKQVRSGYCMEDDLYNSLLIHGNFINSSCALVKREQIIQIGGHDNTLLAHQDYDLWLRLSKHTKVKFIPLPLICQRIHQGSISTNFKSKFLVRLQIYENLGRNHESLKVIKDRLPKMLADTYNYLSIISLHEDNRLEAIANLFKSVKSRPCQKKAYSILLRIMMCHKASEIMPRETFLWPIPYPFEDKGAHSLPIYFKIVRKIERSCSLSTTKLKGVARKLLTAFFYILFIPSRLWKQFSFRIDNINTILLSASHFGLGNTVLMTPMLQTLKKNLPGKKLFVIINSLANKELFERLSYIDKVILIQFEKGNELKKGIRIYRNKIKVLEPDIYVSHFLHNLVDFSIWGFFSGAKYRITYNDRLNGCFDTFFLPNDKSKHEVERNLEIARFLGAKEIFDELDVRLNEDEIEFAKQFLAVNDKGGEDIILGIHAGCDKTNDYKRWPIERFLSIARLFSKRQGAKVLFFTGPDEMDLLPVLESVKDDNITVCSGLNLGQVIGLISRCDVFLSNDSGLMHIAAALQIPVVALFGSSSPIRNRPWGTRHILLKKVKNGDVDSLNSIQKFESIKLIEESEVMDAINTLTSKIKTE